MNFISGEKMQIALKLPPIILYSLFVFSSYTSLAAAYPASNNLAGRTYWNSACASKLQRDGSVPVYVR